MSATELLQAIVDGILTGGVYALMAAGLTLIFGVMDIINIAQGIMVILGGYLSYELSVHIGIGLLPGVLLLIALYAMRYRTKFGRGIRASLQNRTAADLMGVNVNRTRTISVGIGVAVTAIGGMVFGATTAFNPNSGYDLISRLLAIVILGGMGSIGGAMAAAIFMLVVNDVVAVAWSPTWAPLVFFAALVVVLSIRPQGLFGSTAVRAQ